MSILIKGMEMPKNCGECAILDEYGECQILKQITYKANCIDGKLIDCPLIEVPNPNINADELIVGYQVMKKQDGVKYSFLKNGLIKMTEAENEHTD